MNWASHWLWLIPALPLLAAGLTALAKQRHRKFAGSLAIGSMVLALVLSCIAFAYTVRHAGIEEPARHIRNFPWLQFGEVWLRLGWVLDPLSALMLVMVSLVGLLIFIYSLGYMAHDENFARFFCFLSLFAAAMLGLVIANSLLLLFICWELVGFTSYLLIGFWYHKPSAAAAAKKAFIVTRIGDLALLLGLVWLYSQTGTLLFYDDGHGCLEPSALVGLAMQTTSLGLAVSTGIGLLIFCGAIGKSGQVPLHVWLPDAMEGPTPVSALIHAATMVAAGVFLIARTYPLMAAPFHDPAAVTVALCVVTWVGALTAVFAASIAIAQTDIKRILAYSTVSQLGFMMLGLGVGGVAVGMFHLITHAFFKALLFAGAGSVIHGCNEEQDIRGMGGLRKFMPLTFATYAVGMLALAGFPLFFSGFWSKDEVLHAALVWKVSRWPLYMGLFAGLLTAFYMTRQVCYVFFGPFRSGGRKEVQSSVSPKLEVQLSPTQSEPSSGGGQPHESPRDMTGPLIVLAAFSILLGFIGTPAWPWFQAFLDGHHAHQALGRLFEPGVMALMAASAIMVFAGMGMGWGFYGRTTVQKPDAVDSLSRLWPNAFALLQRKYFVDEIYEWAIVGLNVRWASLCDLLDRWLWNGVVQLASYVVLGLAWLTHFCDERVVNPGFDQSCQRLSLSGGLMSRLQSGRIQYYLRILALGLVVLMLVLIWGCRAS